MNPDKKSVFCSTVIPNAVRISIANAIILHEAYFDILGENGKEPSGRIADAIVKYYGSFENWMKHFTSLGLAARGWVVLAYDFNEGRLRNYIADAHNLYGIWGAAPIIVLDVYEHAYFIDFGSDRPAYIKAFWDNLDWAKVNSIYLKAKSK